MGSVSVAEEITLTAEGPETARLLTHRQAAYWLALRLAGDEAAAEDAVQEAYLTALRLVSRDGLPTEERPWFLQIVANAARRQLRGERRRRRREAVVMPTQVTPAKVHPMEQAELAAAARRALLELEPEMRAAVNLCCEQGLEQKEAAVILGAPERNVSYWVSEGLERLRTKLTRQGYAAAGGGAAVIGAALSAGRIPPVPAKLSAAIEGILAGKGTTSAATATAAAKGEMAMKIVVSVVAAGVLAGGVAVVSGLRTGVGAGLRPAPTALSSPPAVPAAGVNPVTGRQDREEVFEFAEKPKAVKQGDKTVIAFASKGKCDATVAIVDGQGKIVRHLASGVLGANAPWPFKQGSLSQSVEWDGKDDTGKPAPAGCKVKVGLGLKASYGLAMAYAPYHLYPFGVACDREGNAYVMIADRLMGDHNIRVFSREGKYLRTILPQPGGLDAKEYAAAFDVHGPAGSEFLIDKPDRIGGLERGMGMAVSSKGLLAFSDAGYRVKKFLYTIRTDGTGLTRGSQLGPWQQVVDRSFLAFSKDETQVYASGQRRSEKEAYHCVFRFGLNDPAPKEWKGHDWGANVPVFAGDKDKAGGDDAHFSDPRGVATDKDGNVYVCDYGNNRVQVLGPDAKFLRSIKIDRPDQVAVHRKTGQVYVLNTDLLTWQTKKTPTSSRITKFSPEGGKLAVFEFPGCQTGNAGWTTHFALDDSADPATLWIANAEELWSSGKGLWRVADKGASFEKLGDVAAYEAWNPWADGTSEYIGVDPQDKWLYMKNSRLGGYASNLARFDAATGKREEKWSVTGKLGKNDLPAGSLPNGIDEEVVGPDGLLYIRGCVPSIKGDPEYVWRVKPETGEEVPFPAAEGGRIKYPGWHSPKFHRDGFGVAPNGDVQVIWHTRPDLTKDGKYAEPWRAGPLILSVYGADGKLKREDIMPGIPYGSCGVRTDRAGNIYTALLLRPADKPYPELLGGLPEAQASFKRRASVVSTTIGTLCKFGPEGGKVERGKEGAYTLNGRDRIAIPGLKAGYVGLGKFGTGCVCRTCRFDLDGFDRAYAPIADLACVMVLDANFNRVARIGRYGNADNGGPQSAFPKPEIGLFRPSYVTVNDKSLYIADRGNLRVLKTALGYHAEETAPLP